MNCHPIFVSGDNLLYWSVLIMWSKWVQWQYKRCSERVNNDYPVKNIKFYNLNLEKINKNLKLFKFKTSFL